MRQVFSPLARIVCVLIYSFVLVACENIDDILLFKNVGDPQLFQNDPDAEADANTADVELDNAELITLGVVQSTLLATQNTALYKFLDASDLPEGASLEVPYICVSGTATYIDSRKTLVENDDNFENDESPVYQVGDTMGVEYDLCENSEGLVYSGSMSARYTEINGLNPTFKEIDAFSCVNNLADDLADSASFVEEGNIYEVTADELQFRPVGGNIEVDSVIYSYIPDPSALDELLREDTVIGTISYDRHTAVIFANMRSNLPAYEGLATSLGGDQIYQIIEGVAETVDCQQYERTLSVVATDFSTEKEGLTTTLNGSLELVSVSENLHKRDATIKDSAFRTTVKQANLVEEFYMSDYTAATYFDENEEVYAYNFSGEVSSDAIFGNVTLAEGNDFIRYSAEEQPHSGAMVILGQGLERLQLTVDSQFLQILVDHDGDSDGNTLPDYDNDIETSWIDLLERDFVELN